MEGLGLLEGLGLVAVVVAVVVKASDVLWLASALLMPPQDVVFAPLFAPVKGF